MLPLYWLYSTGPVLNSELEGWLSEAEASHLPARAIIAPYPLIQ